MKTDYMVYTDEPLPIVTVFRYLNKKVLILTFWLRTSEYAISIARFPSNKVMHDAPEDLAYGIGARYRTYASECIPREYKNLVEESLKIIENNSHCYVMCQLLNVKWAQIRDEKISKFNERAGWSP